MNPTVLLAAAQHGFTIETDIPLVIQGFIMIALATLPLLTAGRNRRREQQDADAHEEHIIHGVLSALEREQNANADAFKREQAYAHRDDDETDDSVDDADNKEEGK